MLNLGREGRKISIWTASSVAPGWKGLRGRVSARSSGAKILPPKEQQGSRLGFRAVLDLERWVEQDPFSAPEKSQISRNLALNGERSHPRSAEEWPNKVAACLLGQREGFP